ncbi:hypothetical protein PP427_gp180 [Salmonella phage KM16]|nr:hypothetical protein PP427_gp180 [Salmonella phage KM16]
MQLPDLFLEYFWTRRDKASNCKREY